MHYVGLGEVGIYRVAGVMRDLDELSKAFDTGDWAVDTHMQCILLTTKTGGAGSTALYTTYVRTYLCWHIRTLLHVYIWVLLSLVPPRV